MRKLLFACIFMHSVFFYGQKTTELSIQQDIRLMTIGDNKGNNPLTVNVLSKLETSVLSFEKSFISLYLSFEYADLVNKNYLRYSLGTGYNIKSIYKRIGAAVYLDYGKIYRKDEEDGFNSFSLSGELNYKINDQLKIIISSQITERKDLTVLYNSGDNFKYSCFLGLKYKL